MFLQVLYAVVKGLLEMDGYVVNGRTPPAPTAVNDKTIANEGQCNTVCHTPQK